MKRFVASVALLLTADAAFAAPGVALADLSSVILSLTLVIGFIFGAAWLVRRAPFSIGRGNGPLKVLAALPLGAKERLLLVEARGTELLIAVSPAGVFNVGTPAPAQSAVRAPIEPTFTLPEQP
jgi:flagellar protein FliO/FliZ